MGSPPSEFPDFRLPPFDRTPDDPSGSLTTSAALPAEEPMFLPPPMPRVRERRTRYVILFLLTVVTTTYMGANHYLAFQLDFGRQVPPDLSIVQLLLRGFWYSASILGILGAHEFGHYFACRYYRVNASLPYFLPVPPPFFSGTLGAVIRIREPIPTKRALFDIGIAGPIAGFIVAVPVLFIGMALSRVVPLPTDMVGYNLGEPLLLKAARTVIFGRVAAGYDVNLHPMAFAAWFGMLATALNLFPIGQLDGGHISYAVLGRRSTLVTFAMVGVLVALTFVSLSWLVWALLTIGMLFVFGPRHPRTYDEHVPLDRTRLWLALFAVIMFVLCFTPSPIEPLDLVGGR